MSVESRLRYIEGEIGRVEGNISELQGKMEGKRMEIVRVQGSVGGAAD